MRAYYFRCIWGFAVIVSVTVLYLQTIYNTRGTLYILNMYQAHFLKFMQQLTLWILFQRSLRPTRLLLTTVLVWLQSSKLGHSPRLCRIAILLVPLPPLFRYFYPHVQHPLQNLRHWMGKCLQPLPQEAIRLGHHSNLLELQILSRPTG